MYTKTPAHTFIHNSSKTTTIKFYVVLIQIIYALFETKRQNNIDAS